MEYKSHYDFVTQRRRFTSIEDQQIIHLVEDLKIHSWEEVARHIPFRTASQCRDRYNHYLSVKVVNKPWSLEEDEIIYNRFRELGPLWSVIAKDLPGRNGSGIKNRFYSKNFKERMEIINSVNNFIYKENPEDSTFDDFIELDAP